MPRHAKELGYPYADARQRDAIVVKCDHCGAIFRPLKHNLQRAHKHLDKDSTLLPPQRQ